MTPRFKDWLLRLCARCAHRLLLLVKDSSTRAGVHAIALTPDSRIILVRLRYAQGWRLPGGGRKKGEDAREAVLRELKEEIGMTEHGNVRGGDALWLVENVRYDPGGWSWEVESVIEAPLNDLPDEVAPVTRKQIAQFREEGCPGLTTGARSR